MRLRPATEIETTLFELLMHDSICTEHMNDKDVFALRKAQSVGVYDKGFWYVTEGDRFVEMHEAAFLSLAQGKSDYDLRCAIGQEALDYIRNLESIAYKKDGRWLIKSD